MPSFPHALPRARTLRGAAPQPPHGLLVVSLGGQGQYECVINDTGSPTSGTETVPSKVVRCP
ncbi:hypothetical protein [Streptomyces sp. NPDC048392]|uniref:hypothetical protein n=1 Tax=Streptomyces sp. NPDC048392 TaxID=3365543 RepID=UPI0037110902